MAYLGRGIENLSDRVVLDSLTASATASYTLQLNSVNFVPSSAESLTVSLNGVIQAPISSYTVSGSTLTFASALTSSDSIDFIIAERGITLQTPSAGSVGTSQLASTAVTTAKIADDAVTKDKLLSHNYPAFFARLDGSQVVNDNTATKVTINEEYFDTDSCFDHQTNYRFTPNVAGKYFLYGQIWFDAVNNANNLNQATIYIYKNTSNLISINRLDFRNTYGGRFNTLTTSFIADANGSSDYFELFGNVNVQSLGSQGFYATSANTDGYTTFGAYRIGD